MRRNTFSYRISGVIGALAQLVEQRPEEPCVPSSSLGGATIDDSNHLRAPWRSGYAEVCKTFYTGSIPVGASSTFIVYDGQVAELVYAVDLKSAGFTTLWVRVPPCPPLILEDIFYFPDQTWTRDFFIQNYILILIIY